MQRFILPLHIALYNLQIIEKSILKILLRKIKNYKKMKSIKYLVVFALTVVFSMSSCTKDNSIIDVTDTKPVEPKNTSSNPLVSRGVTGEDGVDLGCFTVKFPFQLSVNGDNVSISSEDDFAGVFDNSNPSDSFFVDFVYPLEITYNDSGDVETINDGEALGNAFAKCVPDSGWATEFPAFLINESNSCFSLNYPVKLIDEDSVEYTAADENAFVDLIANHEFLAFVFPVSLTNIKTQETVEVSNATMLFELLMSCDPIITSDTTVNPGYFGAQIACYSVGFPVNYTDQNGEVSVANNLDELMEAFLSGKFVDYSFPLTLVAVDSTTLVVSNEEELGHAVEECGDFAPGVDTELLVVYLLSTTANCFEIVYPVTITSDGGATTSVLADEDAFVEEIYNDISSEIVYPFTLLDVASNENKVFNNSDELFGYLSQCQQ